MMQRRRHGKARGPRPSYLRRPKSYKVICSGCGKEVVTQVPPPNDKKLLCMECFSRIEISKEER
jgi:CxxC-x17-CxxC domain-containing protein